MITFAQKVVCYGSAAGCAALPALGNNIGLTAFGPETCWGKARTKGQAPDFIPGPAEPRRTSGGKAAALRDFSN